MYHAHMASPSKKAAPIARRRAATNLSLRTDLVRRAKALDINVSRVLEPALEEAIRIREREAWLAENERAIAAYNARVAKRGVFSDRWRKF